MLPWRLNLTPQGVSLSLWGGGGGGGVGELEEPHKRINTIEQVCNHRRLMVD